MKIYLIGMPGSGKSTLGKQAAEELDLEFVDLDFEIEQHEGISIGDIFQKKGQDHFRLIESQMLSEWAASPKSFVMATGGGTPCFYKGIDIINQTGVSVFIDVPLEVLADRTENKTHRPLLYTTDGDVLKKKLADIREQRLKIYSQAKIVLHQPELHSLLKALAFKK
jgi:shikimate kinase